LDPQKLVLLIDGYNVIAPVAAPGRGCDPRWLERERALLIKRLRECLPDSLLPLTCVVFDAADPPPDASELHVWFGVNVRFAINYPEADDLIEELILSCSTPKKLTVVSSDRRIQAAAKRRSSFVFESITWFDQLLAGDMQLAPEVLAKLERERQGQGREGKSLDVPSLSPEEVDQWLSEFEF